MMDEQSPPLQLSRRERSEVKRMRALDEIMNTPMPTRRSLFWYNRREWILGYVVFVPISALVMWTLVKIFGSVSVYGTVIQTRFGPVGTGGLIGVFVVSAVLLARRWFFPPIQVEKDYENKRAASLTKYRQFCPPLWSADSTFR